MACLCMTGIIYLMKILVKIKVILNDQCIFTQYKNKTIVNSSEKVNRRIVYDKNDVFITIFSCSNFSVVFKYIFVE